ncbi:hypothetical protein A4X13_0g9299 [Tilletia indica]|uniref:Uncharacterized protein n=1 Tax=Tilletia indica TaxID=43049 RepID=A0A8T8SAA9_9BASI|nr:hypothetical protein A4X13_0g9299 [Tilletia indica]
MGAALMGSSSSPDGSADRGIQDWPQIKPTTKSQTRGPHWLRSALLTPNEGLLGGIHATFETSVPMQGNYSAVRTPSINGRPYDRSLPVPGYFKPIEESAVKNPDPSEPGVTDL